MGVKITRISNGLMFDTSELPGSGIDFDEKLYFPLSAMNTVILKSDRVRGYTILGDNWDMNIDGGSGIYPISLVGGVAPISINDLFDKLIALIN